MQKARHDYCYYNNCTMLKRKKTILSAGLPQRIMYDGVLDYNRYRVNECGKNLSGMGSVSVSFFYRVIKILTKD